MSTQDHAAPRQQPSSEPRQLGGRYELGAVLGYGGMAVVRKATDLRLGRTVAVKLLRGELTESWAFQARFRREARAAAALSHPAIVGVYDAGEETIDGVVTSYIVMEYVEGQTLHSLIRSGPQPPERALEITAGVLAALEESHRCGIVHRDIKPANVMLTASGAVKVMDFGVARALADMSAALTQTAMVIGTAHYLSPEQARGDSVDARSDVYSTGCLLYELLTGRPPFDGDSAVAVAYQHVRESPRPPSVFAPGLTSAVDSIVLAALAKDPGRRYQSAEKMRNAITAVLAGEQALVPMAPVETTADLPAVTGPAEPTTTVLDPEVADPRTTAQGPDAADPDTASAGRAGRRRLRTGLVVAAAAALALGLGGVTASLVGDDPGTGQPGQRSARGDNGGPSGPRQPSAEPTGPSADDPASAEQRPQPQVTGDAGTDEDPREVAVRNRAGVAPPADRQTETSDPPTTTSTAEPTTPRQPSPPVAEPTETTAPEATESEAPTESAEPEPTPSEEPPADTPSTSPGNSTSTT